MNPTIIQQIKSTCACKGMSEQLDMYDLSLTDIDNIRDNCGMLSPSAEAEDIKKGNEAILLYIDSLRGKQRCITPAEISKELGYSENFIEAILVANGFQED